MRRVRFHVRSASGFTIIELMITIAVMAVLAMLAIPSFNSFIAGQQAKTGAHDLFLDLLYARSEAIKLNSSVYVAATGGDWANGWVVTTVSGKTYAQCESDLSGCIKLQDAVPNVTFTATASSVTYQGNGRIAAGATPTVTVCDGEASAGVPKRIIRLDLTGRPNIDLSGMCNS